MTTLLSTVLTMILGIFSLINKQAAQVDNFILLISYCILNKMIGYFTIFIEILQYNHIRYTDFYSIME
jgi:hypothetical protein